jgi:hypothetical protein
MGKFYQLLASVLVFLTFNASATDTYNHLNNQLSIPAVILGDTVYRDVVITVGEVLTVGGSSNDSKYPAKPSTTIDTYDPVTNRLTIPNVNAFGMVYHDVIVTVDKVISIRTNELIEKDIACTQRSSIDSLNASAIYNFTGLTSNWGNKLSIIGAEDNEVFTIAFSNFSAIAAEKKDFSLKSLLVSKLHGWADSNAFQGSRLCWSPSKGWDSTCTQWLDPNGNDLSAIQDNNFIMEMVESLRRSYSLLSDWAKVSEPSKHKKIMEWLNFWDINTPNPDNVFFGLGMGRYHWEIQRIKDINGISATIPLVNKLMSGINPLINDDGSIVNRTTRGNRGMWYHYSSLNEIVTSIYLAREAGVYVRLNYFSIHWIILTILLNGQIKDLIMVVQELRKTLIFLIGTMNLMLDLGSIFMLIGIHRTITLKD